jgi:hypothetical protein
MTASFKILSISSFTYLPFIRRCIVLVTEEALLNRQELQFFFPVGAKLVLGSVIVISYRIVGFASIFQLR